MSDEPETILWHKLTPKESDPIDFTEDIIQLDVVKLTARQWIDREFLTHANLSINEAIGDQFGRWFVIQWRMAGQKSVDQNAWVLPSDWWQYFKQRWFPKWLLKRHPVKFTTYKLNMLCAYPRIALPEHQHGLFVYKEIIHDK
jgi:hypothetical protein